MAAKKPDTEVPVYTTGRDRAERDATEKLKWQEEYYKNTPPFTPSRQNMRFLKRLIAKKEASEQKRKAIATRRQKRPHQSL
jgi:hypothetical protein